eukprot:scaffold204169_cov35-Attheya_sp.AAC.1
MGRGVLGNSLLERQFLCSEYVVLFLRSSIWTNASRRHADGSSVNPVPEFSAQTAVTRIRPMHNGTQSHPEVRTHKPASLAELVAPSRESKQLYVTYTNGRLQHSNLGLHHSRNHTITH